LETSDGVPSQRRSLRVVIADDSLLVREGVAALLQQFGHTVVATVQDVDALIAAVEQERPDLVVVDVRMPPGYSEEGLRAAAELRRRRPRLPIMVLSQYVATAYIDQLLAGDEFEGAGLGYLLKDRISEVTAFCRAVDRVAAGQLVLDPSVLGQILARTPDGNTLSRLTPREHEVLTMMSQGKSNGGIARTLGISEAGVAKNITGIFEKLPVDAPDGNRRVLSVLWFLRASEQPG
jgi:DNA-binding NarL/FixJ family response regulator